MKFFRNLKHIFAVTALSLLLIFGLLRMLGGEFTNSMNGFFLYRTSGGVWQDFFHRHSLTPSADIAIIAIDENTLNTQQEAKENLKMLTIPKSDYAILVKKLENVGVKGIAFDIVFQNKDITESLLAAELQRHQNITLAIEYHPDFCILAYNTLYTSLSNTPESRGKYPKYISSSSCPNELQRIYSENKDILSDAVRSLQKWSVLESTIDPAALSDSDRLDLYCIPSDGIHTCPGLPRSLYAPTTWGMINVGGPYDRPLVADTSRQPYRIWKTGTGSVVGLSDMIVETLPFALYNSTYTGARLSVAELPTYSRVLRDSIETRIPHILQPFFGPPETYPRASFSDVLAMSMEDLAASFHGKYVFIGESGTHIKDSLISPVTNTSMDGVEFHAHFLDGLLQNKMLSKIDPNIIYALIVSLVLLTAILYLTIPKYLSPIIAITTLCLILYISRYAYDVNRVVVDIFPLFLAGGVVTFPITFIYRFFIVDREKRKLQNNFGHYIDPHVVEQIADRGEEIQLGGESRVLSVLFSDIAGFTTISESLNARDLFYLMTSYLSNMTDILIGQGGTLDKYIGDAVMGFFGAPLAYEDHAIRAANTALLMRAQLPLFNIELEHHGLKPIDFRVGIAAGEVMVGNIGSHDRFNYTVLGDTVNLASRLEGTGKEYDVHIIISEDTEKLLSPVFFTRELDTIAVKGKTKGVRIYELVGYSKDYPDRTMYVTYEKALRLYRDGDYREAGKVWQTIAKMDPPSRIMMFRCLEILKGTITVEDGIYHMTHK